MAKKVALSPQVGDSAPDWSYLIVNNLLPGYYPPSPEQFKNLLTKGMVVLDTNVLLGLYRRNEAARTAFLAVLQKIQSQLWIPFQVALEYQANRPRVRRERYGVYDELQNVLDAAQGSLKASIGSLNLRGQQSQIDCAPTLAAIETAFNDLRNQIQASKSKTPPNQGTDPIRDALDSYFDGRVGDPPKSQSEVELYNQEAKERFKNKIPPGYRDYNPKQKTAFVPYRDLLFDRRFGDYVLWRQIINEASSRQDLVGVLLVADDRKDDWWWEDRGETLGPKPELANEIVHRAKIPLFWMYSPEKFLEYAGEALEIDVPPKSAKRFKKKPIRLVEAAEPSLTGATSGYVLSHFAERAAVETIQREFDHVVLTRGDGFPDIIATGGQGGRVGYEITTSRSGGNIRGILRRVSEHYETRKQELNLDVCNAVVVALNEDAFLRISLDYRRGKFDEFFGSMGVYLAKLDFSEMEESQQVQSVPFLSYFG